jgi:hypothetical protein
VVSGSALEEYLAGAEPRFGPLARQLDRLIMSAGPALHTRIAYKILLYALGSEKRTWVCAIDVRAKVVSLRFLYGVMLDDPGRVLRAGTSTLMTLDLASMEQLDAGLVTDLVGQAVARFEDFKASKVTG